MLLKHIMFIRATRVYWYLSFLFLGLVVACATEQMPQASPLTPTQPTASPPTLTANVPTASPTATLPPTSGILPTATIGSEPTVTLSSTPLPTRLPAREAVALQEPIGSIAFINSYTLWLVAKDGQDAQAITLDSRDDILSDTLVQSMDGSHLAWLAVSAEEQAAAIEERRNIVQAYPIVLDLNRGELIRYYEIPVAYHSGLAWPTTNSHLYLKRFDPDPARQTDLFRLELETSETEKIATVGGSYDLVIGDFALLEESHLLFPFIEAGNIERQQGQVSILTLDLNNGESEILVDVLEQLDWHENSWENARVQFSLNPAGDSLAFTVSAGLDTNMRQLEKQGLYLFERSTDTLEQIISEAGLGQPVWSPDGQRLAVSGGVAEGSTLLIYSLNATDIITLTNEQLTQIKQIVNPEDKPLTFLSTVPVAWLSNQELLLRTTIAFTEAPGEVQQEIMIMNVDSGEVETPSWLQ